MHNLSTVFTCWRENGWGWVSGGGGRLKVHPSGLPRFFNPTKKCPNIDCSYWHNLACRRNLYPKNAPECFILRLNLKKFFFGGGGEGTARLPAWISDSPWPKVHTISFLFIIISWIQTLTWVGLLLTPSPLYNILDPPLTWMGGGFQMTKII